MRSEDVRRHFISDVLGIPSENIKAVRLESKEELESMHSGNAGVIRAIDEVRAMNLSRRLKAWYELRLRNQRDRRAI